MTPGQQQRFYEEARSVRDMDAATVNLVLEAESLNIDTASVAVCKYAITKWQYISDERDWKWSTNRPGLMAAVRKKRK